MPVTIKLQRLSDGAVIMPAPELRYIGFNHLVSGKARVWLDKGDGVCIGAIITSEKNPNFHINTNSGIISIKEVRLE